MPEFIYQEPFPVGEDTTEYRLLTKEYVKVVECDGRKILKVDPKGFGRSCRRPPIPTCRSTCVLRILQKLRNILEDSEASDNDQLRGLHHAAEPVPSRPKANCPPARTPARPSASATRARTSGRAPTTPSASPRGVYETYKDRNLRYSQVVPFTMTDEKNSGTNLPAQIDIYGGHPGMEYEFLFITKGGGSANKTFLYQQTKALLNEETLTEIHPYRTSTTSARRPARPTTWPSASAARRPRCASRR